MQFTLTLNGDTSTNQDRELLALLFGSASPVAISVSAPAPINQPVPMPQPVAAAVEQNDDDQPAAAGAISGVDKNGFPHDNRIHSGNGAKNADGSWRSRRGLDPNTKAVVEAELRGRMSIPQPAPQLAPVPQPMPAAPVAVMPPMPVAAVAPIAAIPAPAPMPAPVPVAQPAAAPVVDFMFILTAIQNGVKATLIDGAYIASLATRLGLTEINQLNGDNQRCWQAYEIMVADQKYVSV